MFFTNAYAQGAGGAAANNPMELLMSVAPLILIFVVFYFVAIRPQRMQMKRRQEMLNNIRRNDQIVTGGGIIGKVTKVIDDKEVEVEIAENVRVRVNRALISDIRGKGEPINDNKDK